MTRDRFVRAYASLEFALNDALERSRAPTKVLLESSRGVRRRAGGRRRAVSEPNQTSTGENARFELERYFTVVRQRAARDFTPRVRRYRHVQRSLIPSRNRRRWRPVTARLRHHVSLLVQHASWCARAWQSFVRTLFNLARVCARHCFARLLRCAAMLALARPTRRRASALIPRARSPSREHDREPHEQTRNERCGHCLHQAHITSLDATIARTRVGKRKAAIFVETSLYHPRAHENARGAREGCAAEVTRRASRARSASSRARRARGLARARTTDAVCGRRYIGIFEALFFVVFAVKNYKRTPRRFVRLR